MTSPLRSQFLLDPSVVFLNHGSYGACPIPVFETYQNWQRELERQPVEFIGRRSPGLLSTAREQLGKFLNAPASDLVYFTNSTGAFNAVARSLNLQPGDEILATDQEYPAMLQAWSYFTQKTGSHFVQRPVKLPLTSAEEFVEDFWAGVTSRTKVIFISHIPYTLAVILPVAEICRRARQAGLVCIVDGAHAPGQIPLDLQQIQPDVYFGACHKWLCAPKGASFLYARPEAQRWIQPLIISRGWDPDVHINGGSSTFIEYHEYQGTRDLSAFLSVPAAIQFQLENNWPEQRLRCHQFASATRSRINALTGLEAICPDSQEWFNQLVTVRLPEINAEELGRRLYDNYRVEVPTIARPGFPPLMRISFQAYNDQEDADALLRALEIELPEMLRAA